MIAGKNVVVVMPAYNAESTIEKTWQEVMAQQIVDLVIVVDDRSRDGTVARAKALPNVIVHEHEKNLGYGGNQKTCYRLAVEHGADIVIMVHPDYQYTPKLIPAMAGLVASGIYQCVLGSRVLGGGAIKGRMPWWRYVANRFLTAADNILIGSKLSEFHTGYRAFSRDLLTRLPLEANSDDFVFDNQMLAQIKSGWVSRLEKSHAQRGTPRMLRRSTFAEASSMGSDASGPHCCSDSANGELRDRRSFRKRRSHARRFPRSRISHSITVKV